MNKRRRPLIWILVLTVFGLLALLLVPQPTVIFLVRHADKAAEPTGDPGLTTPGTARANDLARALEKAGVEAIYTSEYRRTKDTAAPLAAQAGVTAREFPARDVEGLVDDILAGTSRTVVVVGHSDTVPQIVEELGGASFATIAPDEYDNVYVVTRRFPWRARTVHLQYGAASP